MADSFWSDPPIAIAHRGGDAAGPEKENTLVAFKAARQAGFSYGETDAILSKDGQVVAIHGATNWLDSMFRHRHSRRRMQGMTIPEMRYKWTIAGETIPTLEEILLSQKKMKFFIDPKTDEVVEPLFKLLKRLNALDQVCVNSFNYDRVQAFRQIAGNRHVQTGLIIGRGLRIFNRSKDRLEKGRLKKLEAVVIHHSLVSRQMLDLIHRQGLKAVIWTCNSEISIKNGLKCGADGIISDHISLLKQLIDS
jgi:glycerophosphoryl diester phosphodiesterase